MPPRRQPAHPLRLTRDRITDVAIDIVRRDGYEALTMRRLAAELDTGQASLYAHVANKSALDRLIVTTMLLGLPAPDGSPDRWRETLIDNATQLYQAVVDHPGIAPALFGSGPVDHELLTRDETVLAALRSVGLTSIEALAAFVGTTLLALARAQEETVVQHRIEEAAMTEEEWYSEMRTRMRSALPQEAFPVMTDLIEDLYPAHRTQVFEEILALVADGIATRIELRTQQGTSSQET